MGCICTQMCIRDSIYAMGGNKQAAKLSGINVKGYRYLAGMITAVFIALSLLHI